MVVIFLEFVYFFCLDQSLQVVATSDDTRQSSVILTALLFPGDACHAEGHHVSVHAQGEKNPSVLLFDTDLQFILLAHLVDSNMFEKLTCLLNL